MNYYLDVFVESMFVSSFIPFKNDPTFFAMSGFGGYDMQLAVALAVLGSMIGAVICFVTGRLIFKMYFRNGGQKSLSIERYDRAARFFSRNIMILMPLTWLPLLKFLPLFSGFLGCSFRTTMLLVILGKIGYYSYYGLM